MVEPKLVGLIRNCVQPHPKPAIYTGGGLDSSIILHHLREKTDEKIYSYTFGFVGEENEFVEAKKVAEHYGTKHSEIVIANMLDSYPEILKNFTRPRFNLWPYWLAQKAKEDARQTCYIGEGSDEHFGGYWYKPRRGYLESWVDLFNYVLPTYNVVHKLFGLWLEAPFLNLDWRNTYGYYDHEQHKRFLRKAYKDVLPDFVLNRKKRPGARTYRFFWEHELKQYFPNVNPHSDAEIRELWNLLVTQQWLKLQPFLKEAKK